MKKFLSCIIAVILITACMTFAACDTHEHSYSEWSFDKTHHWHVCDVCNTATDAEEHVFENKDDENGDVVQVCKICEYVYEEEEVEEHEHNFSEELESNEMFHWKACVVKGCKEQQKSEHSFGIPEVEQQVSLIRRTYCCEVCGYEKVEEITINSVIENEVAWADAFANLTMTNYELVIDFGGDEGRKCVITEEGVYISNYLCEELYSEKNPDGTFTTYARIGEEWYVFDDTNDEFYIGLKSEMSLKLDFSNYFDEFSYNEESGKYFCQATVACDLNFTGGEDIDKMYCRNNKITVADGEITSIVAEYSFDEDFEDIVGVLEYYNIGYSVFSVPESIKQIAKTASASDFGLLDYYG